MGKKKNLLTGLSLDEVSLCAVGMNQEAKVSLAKADARTFSEVQQENQDRKILSERFSSVWEAVYALQDSIASIIESDDVEEKQVLLDQSIEEFRVMLGDLLPNIIAKNEDESNIGSDSNMTLQELQKSLETLTARVTEQETTIATLTAERDLYKGMSDREKSYMATLDDKGSKRFAGLSKDERAAEMDKAGFKKSADETQAAVGTTDEDVVKSLPLAAQTILKDALAKAANAEAIAKAEADKREHAELVHKAVNQFSNVPGTPDEKAALMKSLNAIGGDVQKFGESVLNALQKANTTLLKQQGHGASVGGGTATESFNKALDAYAKDHKTDVAKATDAFVQTKEGAHLYLAMRNEQQGARRSA